jgi:hypothetical protein
MRNSLGALMSLTLTANGQLKAAGIPDPPIVLYGTAYYYFSYSSSSQQVTYRYGAALELLTNNAIASGQNLTIES